MARYRYFSVYTVAIMLCALSGCRYFAKSTKPQHRTPMDYSLIARKLQGTWLSYEYMINLNKTRSPYKSAAFMDGIFSFMIDSNNVLNDTLHITAWINGHEDKGLWIAFDSPDSLGGYSVGVRKNLDYDHEIRTPIADNITRFKIDSPYLIIYTAAFDSIRYIYLDSVYAGRSSDYALRHFTTAALFRGQYFIPDSDRILQSGTIYFDPKNIGKIYGSPAYDSFDINTDLSLQQDTMDYMELFDSRKQTESRSFTYTIKKNTISLYPHLENRPNFLYKSDPLDTLPLRR